MRNEREASAVRREHDTPLGRFVIAWGTSGGMEEFPPPAPAGDAHDLHAMDPAGAQTIELVEPRHGQGKSLELYRSRARPDNLYVLAEITNGVWAQGTRVALPYPGPPDRIRDAWIVGRPASTYDARTWETLAVEPYLLTLMRRGDEHAFEIHAESGFGFRKALYPLDPSRADGLRQDRHARILLAAALHHDVQSDAAPDVADFAAFCDLVLAGPSAALSERLETARDVRFMLRHAYGVPPDGDAFTDDWFETADRESGSAPAARGERSDARGERSEARPKAAGLDRLIGELREIVHAVERLAGIAKPPARTRRAVDEEIGLDRDFERLEPALLAIGAEPQTVWRDPRGPDGFVTREYSWRHRLIRVDHTIEGRFAVRVTAEPATHERPPAPDGWLALESLVEPGAHPREPGAPGEESDAETFLRRIAKLPEIFD